MVPSRLITASISLRCLPTITAVAPPSECPKTPILSGFILYFLLYVGRKAFTDSKFSEPLYARVLESMAVSAAIGVIRICAGRGEPVYEYVAFLALCATSAAYTVFFSTLFTEKFAKKSKLGTRSVCLYALMGAVTCAFKGLTVSGFDLQVIVACMLTLVFAAANGFMHAGIVGFVCGMMCMSPWISASMGLAGMAAAFLAFGYVLVWLDHLLARRRA